MPEEHNTVFINYRRKTSAFIARAIFEHLRHHGYDVFMDVESIDSGTFDTIILNQIKARAHFLVILSPGALERCDNPNDWVRREIEFAIEQQRNVVPLMTGGFRFADYEALLTGTLSELPRFNGLNVPHAYFDAAMERLRTRFLKRPVQGTIENAPPSDGQEVLRKLEKTADQPVPTEREMTAEEYFQNGLAKQNAGDLKGAIADYDEAILSIPKPLDLSNSEALGAYYTRRGITRYFKGDLNGAIADFNVSIGFSPQVFNIYYYRGLAYYKQGDLDGAIANYQHYLDLGGGKQRGDQRHVEEWIAELKRRLANE